MSGGATRRSRRGRAGLGAAAVIVLSVGTAAVGQLPSGTLTFGPAVARFEPDGTFTIRGQDWPELAGTWAVDGNEIELTMAQGPRECRSSGRYGFARDGGRVSFTLVSDECPYRRLILDGSTWRPPGDVPPAPDRRFVRTAADPLPPLAGPGSAEGSWPAFRGPGAAGVADGTALPDAWSGETGTNVLWRASVPGLGHSSPIVWGDRVYAATAVSSDPGATFRPGLYGDGDPSEDRSPQQWRLLAFDKHTGEPVWDRVVHEGPPVDRRHMKSTYASATPATDGRVVVVSFGSLGVFTYDMSGAFRWKVDLGRLHLGAYNIPTLEWGTASSPTIWGDLVIVQCDTHADSFVAALDVETGETVWKVDRNELPSWGTPNVAATSAGPQLVTNASNFIRAYDPATGEELWRLGRSSKITAPTPIVAGDLIVVASGRAPERPIFAVRPSARGDLTLAEGESASEAIAWSRTGRGPYMPTPLAYEGILYVLANNGVFDAYDLATGVEIYRQRLPHPGSGFSASPVAADGKIYLSSEDGEILVVRAGRTFELISTNSMGELLMATPALSEGVMYVRSDRSLFAIGARR